MDQKREPGVRAHDTEPHAEAVDLQHLHVEDLPWVEGDVVTTDRQEIHRFHAIQPVTFAEQLFTLRVDCTVKIDAHGSVDCTYVFVIPGQDGGSVNMRLHIERQSEHSHIWDADTDIRRMDTSPFDEDQRKRVFPPHIGRVFYAQVLDFIQHLSHERNIMHTVTALPDSNTTREQWDHAFRDTLLERGYEASWTGNQYRKFYEKAKTSTHE